jgi:aspartate/methionine/tyrosine aminotransferase
VSRFSARVPSDLAPNRLTQALERARREGRPPIDLTESNPTRAGFDYPVDLLAPLSDPDALGYTPRPFGLDDARAAVSADYRRRGAAVPASRLLLTASTSEAYSLLFKVLCDPGDEVLAPRPSYPLFEHLTRLDSVVGRSYELEYHGRWMVDFPSVEAALSDRTRAILLVTPNNPTSSYVTCPEFERIAALSRDRDLAIVADEVFADYELEPGAAGAAASVVSHPEGLIFALGGLSKSIGLPQVKLAWIAVGGGAPEVAAALGRLEVASDAYLSVATPVQVAAARLLERGAAVRHQIQARVRANYAHLSARASGASPCRALRAEGGWYAVLQVPTLMSEESLAVDLVAGGVLVHPGYFYDFASESFLIVSLLPREDVFNEGITRILRHFDCTGGPQ